MCAAGDLDAAERLTRQVAGASLMESLVKQVTAQREQLSLGELSVFERALASSDPVG